MLTQWYTMSAVLGVDTLVDTRRDRQTLLFCKFINNFCLFKILIFLLLFDRWKGSIYKLVWPDLIAFLSIYYALSILYRYVLDPEQKK